MERRKRLRRTSKLKKYGKTAQWWSEWRKVWFKNNPPNDEGYYECGICHTPVHIDKVTLDHIKPRSTHPHLRFDANNVQPAHRFCNNEKASTYRPHHNKQYQRRKRQRNKEKYDGRDERGGSQGRQEE